MSLKARLAVTLALSFAAILILGGALTYMRATTSVETELAAARSVAANRVAQLIAELPAARDRQADLAGFVRNFNGDRHVQVLLIDSTGAVRDASKPETSEWNLPDWVMHLLGAKPTTTVMPLSGSAAPMTAVAVTIDPANELSETWLDFSLSFVILVAFVLLAFLAVWTVADRALRPIGEIRDAVSRIGDGERVVAVTPRGPPEMRDLGAGLNAMARRLDEVSARNRRLSEQLLRLQDEERADLARDLHDGIGPLLFSIDVDAATIARLARKRERATERFGARAEAIKEAAYKARQEVRRILSNLRPGLMPGLGLKASLEDMVSDLAVQHPDVAFEAKLEDGDWGGSLEVLVHRAIRECVNNALRHGSPSRIGIHLFAADRRLAFQVADDGGGLPEQGIAGGYGLIGMRERIEAAGGSLDVTQIPLPPGVRIEAWVPLAPGTGSRVTGGDVPSSSPSAARQTHQDERDTAR